MQYFPTTVAKGTTWAPGTHETSTVLCVYNTVNNGTVLCNDNNANIDMQTAASWSPYAHIEQFINNGMIEAVNHGTVTFNGTDSNGHFMEEVLNQSTILASNGTVNINRPLEQTSTAQVDIKNNGKVVMGADDGTLDGGTIVIQSGMLELNAHPPQFAGGASFGVSAATSMEFTGSSGTLDFNGLGNVLTSFNLANDVLSIYVHGQSEGAWVDAADLHIKPTFGQQLTSADFRVSGEQVIFSAHH